MSLQNYFYNLRGLQSYNMQDKLNGINKNDKIYNKREANAIYEVSCHKIYLKRRHRHKNFTGVEKRSSWDKVTIVSGPGPLQWHHIMRPPAHP